MASRILVVATGYPGKDDPRRCASVHVRTKEYARQGLDVSVCLWNPCFEYPSHDEYDGVRLLRSGAKGLRAFIDETGPYSVIVAHSADVQLLNVLERESHRSRIVLVSHGADILGERYSCHAGAPYFEEERDERLRRAEGAPMREAVRRLLENDAVHWVFVSESLKRAAEDFLELRFGARAHVIGSWVGEDRIAYRKKDPELRRKIYFCRPFDNERAHCADTAMLAIRRLSKRDFFKDLEFHVYGDGGDYERLVAPVREFGNVKLHRGFPDDGRLPELLAGFGVGLFPSRHVAQPVAMQEAALAGLACVGGDVPAVREAFPQDEFGTLADPESPDAVAAAVERLCTDPALFADLSERMSRRVAESCGREKTIDAEIALVRGLAEEKPPELAAGGGEKALSVIVPAYNMEKYLDVCIDSLVRHERAGETEVLVVNDGSTDATLSIANEWSRRFPGVVRVIDKKNGGHGSCVNAALSAATGRYVRVVDADDWVVSSNLARQVERLKDETADCVLTYGRYDYVDDGSTAPTCRYPNLADGEPRTFDDLQFPGYGFEGYGPMLPTSSWKRTVLLESKTRIMEGVFYADMMWNAMPLDKAESVVLYDLDIYRYTMGRAGQSVSREFVLKRWEDHDMVYFAVAEFALGNGNLSAAKRRYVVRNILGDFGCSNLCALHIARGAGEVERFLARVGEPGREELAESLVRCAGARNGDAMRLLVASKAGRRLVEAYAPKSGAEGVAGGPAAGGEARGSVFFRMRALLGRIGVKSLVKAAMPYGIVRRWQQDIYGK